MRNLEALCEKCDLLKQYVGIVKCLKDDPHQFKLLIEIQRKVRSLHDNIESLMGLYEDIKDLEEQSKVQEAEIKHLLYSLDQIEKYVSTPKAIRVEEVNNIGNTNGHYYNSVEYVSNSRISAPKSISYDELSPIIMSRTPIAPILQPQELTFDMHLLENSEFQALPKYMVGRLTMDDINGFINLVNEVVLKKYNILGKHQAQLKSSELSLYNKYKKQQQTLKLKGKHFITEDDIAMESGQTQLGKKAFAYLTILRHTKKLIRSNVHGFVIYTIPK